MVMAMEFLVRNFVARMARICPVKNSLLLSFLLLTEPVFPATVLSVGDGDTLTVDDGGRRATVRLACIDAPETAQAPYGLVSRQHLQKLAPVGSVVTLRAQATDRYGRTVAEVIRRGQNLNLTMVREGQAFAYRQYLEGCDARAYLTAEEVAEKGGRNVWSVPGGIQRPWDYRAARRSQRAPTAGASAPTGGQRLTCAGIGDYGRAQQLLRQGHTYLDRNGDGVACESLK